MDNNENRERHRFERVVDFVTGRGNDFAPTSLGKQLANTLATIITELEGHATAEGSAFGSERLGTSTRREARDALRADLEAIARTARAMASDLPGLADKFRMPGPDNDQRLLDAGRAAAADAVPYSAQFTAHELTADFFTALNAHIADLKAAIGDQARGSEHHVRAREAIDDAIDRGVEIVRKLDAIVKNKYANNAAVLAEWTAASHKERAPRSNTPPAQTSPGEDGGATPSK
jgi:hypothetical protein